MGTRRPRVVLFDLDGVIRHYDPAAVTHAEQALDLSPGTLLEAAFAIPEYADGVIGRCSFADWGAAVVARLVADGIDAARARTAVGSWLDDRGTVDAAVLSIVRAVGEQTRVGLLSNAHDHITEDLELHALSGHFEVIVSSAAIGLAKPDAAIYRAAAEAFGVRPADCFFTDDLEPNVAGARAAGMDAEQYVDAPALAAALRARGLEV